MRLEVHPFCHDKWQGKARVVTIYFVGEPMRKCQVGKSSILATKYSISSFPVTEEIFFVHKTTNATSKGAPSLWIGYKQHHFQRETANKLVSDHSYKNYAHKTANEYVKYI